MDIRDIYKTDLISIGVASQTIGGNGAIIVTPAQPANMSQSFLGGVVYNANFSQGFNGSPSVLSVDIVSKSGTYQEPELSYEIPYTIALGSNITLNMWCVKSTLEEGERGKILRCEFQDGTFRLNRWWIGLKSLYDNNNTDIPNVIKLGFTLDELVSKGLPKPQFDCYDYDMFQKETEFLGIPKIPTNKFMTVNQSGTVLSVFNLFMRAYGYSWYMDRDNNIQLIDKKNPIGLNAAILDKLKTHPKRLNWQKTKDITDNVSRGVLAVQDSDKEKIILASATPFWGKGFMGIPFKVTDPDACIAATVSKECFFAYMLHKYTTVEALNAIGYKVVGFSPVKNAMESQLAPYMQQVTQLKSPVGGDKTYPFTYVFAYEELPDNEANQYEVARQIGEFLKRKPYYVFNNFPEFVIEWKECNSTPLPNQSKIVDLQPFGPLLDMVNSKITNQKFTLIDGIQKTSNFKVVTTSAQTVRAACYIVEFQDKASGEVQYKYIEPTAITPQAFLNTNPNSIKVGGKNPNSIPVDCPNPTALAMGQPPGNVQDRLAAIADAVLKARQDRLAKMALLMPTQIGFLASNVMSNDANFKALHQKITDTTEFNKQYKSAIVDLGLVNYMDPSWYLELPDYECPNNRSIAGRATLAPNWNNSIYAIDQQWINAWNAAPVTSKSSAIELMTVTSVWTDPLDITDFIAQTAFKTPLEPQSVTCDIRGISLGFNITPTDGLRSISIRLDSNGYSSNYALSTSVAEPKDPQTFRQRYPIS